jgi:hypothetical protein
VPYTTSVVVNGTAVIRLLDVRIRPNSPRRTTVEEESGVNDVVGP